MSEKNAPVSGVIVNIVRAFLTSHLSIMLIIIALCFGGAAILVTPKEEEPQIVVPVADIYVQAPGSCPEEVEKLVASPLERFLWQIDGVEYVYSMSTRDMAVITVRFYVGEDRENSLVKLHNKISMHMDKAPAIVKGWVIKPVEIDDVPIVNITLYSHKYGDFELRRIGEEILSRLSEVKDISNTQIIGGNQREVRVELNPELMAGFNVSVLEIIQALKGSDSSVTAGNISKFNKEFTITSNSFLSSKEDVLSLMVGVNKDKPVYLRDIANVIDGPSETSNYTRIGFSNYYRQKHKKTDENIIYPAVTLALAKKKGTNAVNVADNILEKFKELKKDIIPDGVNAEITRNYGETAHLKVNELLSSLAFAIISVIALLAFTLGWKEALIVAFAVPISFALALFVNLMFGYTINRVTLFALILSLGLVVDDPITNVDNIQRHIKMKVFDPINASLFAVNEVLPPVIMSTLAIIVCFLPLFYITGMMGPYMAPMAINVPLTVTFSTVCALSIVPWMSYNLLKNIGNSDSSSSNGGQSKSMKILDKIYRPIIMPFLKSQAKRYMLLLAIIFMLFVCGGLAIFRLVPLKLLPFDNKNEFQIVIDMPEGTTLENTSKVVSCFEDYLKSVPECTNFVSYVGNSSPMDFNGMVRHYYLRKGSNFADVRVNLVSKDIRSQQSHEILLRLRNDLENIAKENNASVQLVEVPPGPPVLSTIVAEISGDADKSYRDLIKGAEHVTKIMTKEPFVVDINDSTEADRTRFEFIVDKEKASLHGVSAEMILTTLRTAIGGINPATVHIASERQPLVINLTLPREKRSDMASLSQIPVKTAFGLSVPMAEFVKIVEVPVNQPIYHKNLERLVFVNAEMAGRAPAEAILDMQNELEKDKMPEGTKVNWAGEGEWKITIDVFRDMGIAYGAALLGIYILLVIQTNSFSMPFLLMISIPLTILGIMPGFFILNLISANSIGGFQNPIFFTATSMIGMIALGGIVIRNSLVLIEFIDDAVKQGVEFKEAILQSGVIRMRPILLTAATTVVGAIPITFDPIFSGLAWALIFGLFASTLFTLLVIPVTYYALNK
ncbi:MAG: efflux RND transporter permease subunit [Desulfobacterales bacterium]|nr:efflux RND transporter permease subunit [Desulfobacterales bacterium]